MNKTETEKILYKASYYNPDSDEFIFDIAWLNLFFLAFCTFVYYTSPVKNISSVFYYFVPEIIFLIISLSLTVLMTKKYEFYITRDCIYYSDCIISTVKRAAIARHADRKHCIIKLENVTDIIIDNKYIKIKTADNVFLFITEDKKHIKNLINSLIDNLETNTEKVSILEINKEKQTTVQNPIIQLN